MDSPRFPRCRLPAERVNFASHALAAALWLPLTAWLAWTCRERADLLVSAVVYGLSCIGLFTASARYHRLKSQENEKSLRRTIDHFMIFVMIAGSYTPIILVWFLEPAKWITLGVQWGVTACGLVLALAVPRRPRWVDPVLYVLMGWVALGVLGWLWVLMDRRVFWYMLGGGLLYTAGAVMYALKRPVLKPGVFGFHELFHLFIVAGAGAHFLMVKRSLDMALGM